MDRVELPVTLQEPPRRGQAACSGTQAVNANDVTTLINRIRDSQTGVWLINGCKIIGCKMRIFGGGARHHQIACDYEYSRHDQAHAVYFHSVNFVHFGNLLF